jgi:4,5-DOPA dioxygenase extradiol
MNAIEDTPYTRAWNALGASMPRPRAILVISAHWYIHRTAVTAMDNPPTIHDFTGFPRELYEMRYPAPGEPQLAADVRSLLGDDGVVLDRSWGLDHGAWSILVHVFPKADVPVVELSIDATKSVAQHFAIGAKLAALRERGVLLLGTGNVVHNLARIDFEAREPFPWAVRFDRFIREAIEKGDNDALLHYRDNQDAPLAAPDIDHFLPVVYIAGARRPEDRLRFIVDGFDAGSISMTGFQLSA